MELKHVGIVEEDPRGGIRTGIAPPKDGLPGKPWKRATLKINGMTFGTFDAHLIEDIEKGVLTLGSNVEVLYQKSGIYNNIIALQPNVSGAPATLAPVPSPDTTGILSAEDYKPEGVDWDIKDRRVIRQNVLRRAVEMYLAGKIPLEGNSEDNIFILADSFERWIHRDKGWTNEKDPEEKDQPAGETAPEQDSTIM